MIIDSQVHVYDAPSPDLPWAVARPRITQVNGDGMVGAMTAVGVAGAIMVNPYAVYRYDGRFARRLAQTHPGHFGYVIPIDPRDPAALDIIADWKTARDAVGIRLMFARELGGGDADDPKVRAVMAAAAVHGLPVNLWPTGNLEQASKLIANHADTQVVIDHLGLETPQERMVGDAFADLPDVLALARFDNAAIKVSGACVLSHEPFPFKDLWEPLARVFDAFGLERCMWGTDWTRTTAAVTYGQSVEAFRMNERLSDSDRATLMGGAVTRIYGWAPYASTAGGAAAPPD